MVSNERDAAESCKIEVYCQDMCLFSGEFSGQLEVGRQRQNEPPPPVMMAGRQHQRLILASLTELDVSRSHLLLEPQGERRVTVTNLLRQGVVAIRDTLVDSGQSAAFHLPLRVQLGRYELHVDSTRPVVPSMIRSAGPASIVSSLALRRPVEISITELETQKSLAPERVVKWVQQILAFFQEVAGTEQFYLSALGGMQQMLNLTSAAVLFYEDGHWLSKLVVSADGNEHSEGWRASHTVLDMVRNERVACRHIPTSDGDVVNSLTEINSVVAAPIFDEQGEVVGAIYGDRRRTLLQGEADISELEMLFVELIASGISSGLIRVEHERRSSAARTRFEQFFPPSLAKRLEDDESFLKGRNCDVSILFCDIRRFSEISERIGPEETVLWINSVMDALSECVLQHNGVLVDYIGDELFAMWGAPDEQPNHAVLACRAALSMLDKLPRLNELWSERIGGPLDIGIGINSGQAQVGNIGSNVKFKYGPLGNSVNIASRIQNATKQLQATALVSEATARLVADKMMLRRLCQIQVVNVQTPITVYELAADQSEEYGELSRLYQAGLAAFESGNSIEACKKLTEVLARYPDDGPSIILLSRAVNQIGHPDAAVDTVWRLDRK